MHGFGRAWWSLSRDSPVMKCSMCGTRKTAVAGLISNPWKRHWSLYPRYNYSKGPPTSSLGGYCWARLLRKSIRRTVYRSDLRLTDRSGLVDTSSRYNQLRKIGRKSKGRAKAPHRSSSWMDRDKGRRLRWCKCSDLLIICLAGVFCLAVGFMTGAV